MSARNAALRIGRRAALTLAGAALATTLLAPSDSRAQADFFDGKTVSIVVGYGPGGGYDTYARLLAPHLEKALGATVIVENKPGGSGLSALNDLVRDSDGGLKIMLLAGEAAALAQLVDKPGTRFDLLDVNFLGRVVTEPRVLLLGGKSKYKTIADLQGASEPIKFAASGRTDAIGDIEATTCEALQLDCRIITGYAGTKGSALAVIQGEADGLVTSESSGKTYSSDDTVRAVATLARKRAPLLPDTPTIFELTDLSPEQAWWIDFRANIAELGRTFVTGPDVPPERVAYLRDVIRKVLTDPAVVAEAEKAQQPIDYAPPEDTVALVKETFAAPSEERRAEIRKVLLEKF